MVQVLVGGCGSGTLCLQFNAADCTGLGVRADDVVSRIQTVTGLPPACVRLFTGTSPLEADAVLADGALCRVHFVGALKGGKGGFGAMLRSSGKGGNSRVENFGACRDLSGRRLRHVNDEIALKIWMSDEEKAKRERMGEFYEAPSGEHGIEGWHLSLPGWAEGFKGGKKRKRLRKQRICRNWLAARQNRDPPAGAPRWWGCGAGRDCPFAHGEEELQGPLAVEAMHRRKEEAKATAAPAGLDAKYMKFEAAKEAVHDGMASAVAAGLARAHDLKRKRAASEVAKKAAFLPVDLTGARRGLRWDTSAWFTSLGQASDLVVVVGTNSGTGAGAGAGAGASASASAGTAPTPDSVPAGVAYVHGATDFGSGRVAGIQLSTGAWYYEVELLTAGVIQLGWADAHFEGNSDLGDGIGDHPSSWSYDGARKKKWNGENPEDYGEAWKAGDVIGCFVDVDVGVFSFAINGKTMGPAFMGADLTAGGGVYPALSLESTQAVRVNIGQAPFVHPPLAPYRAVVAATTTAAAVASDTLPTAAPEAVVAAAGAGAGAGGAAIVDVSAPVVVEDTKEPEPEPEEDAVVPEPKTKAKAAAPAPVPAPAPAPAPAPELKPMVKLPEVKDVAELEALGGDQLKAELLARGLKCGGTVAMRAERLFSVKGLTDLDDVPRKVRGKNFPGPLWS